MMMRMNFGEAPGKGYKNEKLIVVPLTWPAGAGYPLPSGEGFTFRNYRL